MKFTRGKRIALELLGPPALGATILGSINAVINTIKDGPQDWQIVLHQTFQYMIFAVIGSYMFAIAPSALCACLLEWRFSRGLRPDSRRQVALSAWLGLISGTGISILVAGFLDLSIGLLSIFGGTGLVVGFLIGLLIRFWSKEPTGENRP